MKIVVVGLGYVGLSNAVLLAQHNKVIGVDISQERVDALNARKSPIIDAELTEYLAEKNLSLSASTDLKTSLYGADWYRRFHHDAGIRFTSDNLLNHGLN